MKTEVTMMHDGESFTKIIDIEYVGETNKITMEDILRSFKKGSNELFWDVTKAVCTVNTLFIGGLIRWRENITGEIILGEGAIGDLLEEMYL